MGKKKVPYKEGDWFAVPLVSGRYALGIVARTNREGLVLGYFFGPRSDHFPNKEDTKALQSADAILIRRFDDLGLTNGSWKIICETNLWKREEWPVPTFSRVDEIAGKAYRIDYNDDDIKFLREQLVNLKEARTLPKDGVAGYIALERELTKLLTN